VPRDPQPITTEEILLAQVLDELRGLRADLRALPAEAAVELREPATSGEDCPPLEMVGRIGIAPATVRPTIDLREPAGPTDAELFGAGATTARPARQTKGGKR
jgi:hypothetical protein